ncbi:hypothetical protein BRARA_G02829, partial [Brassica rapa]
MINHRICGEAAKMRPLTRKFKTRVYGPWLRCDHKVLACNGLPVKFYYSQPKPFVDMGLTYEETVTYAQFMVVVQVDLVYKSEQEWGGKKLVRSLLDVLAFEIDRISPLAKLTSEDKTSIVLGLVAGLMKQRKTWSKKRWIPCKVRVEKTSDDLLRKTIRDAIRGVGQTQFPDSYVESWVRL